MRFVQRLPLPDFRVSWARYTIKHRHVHCCDLKITVKKHTRLFLFRGGWRDTKVTGQAIKRSYRTQEVFQALEPSLGIDASHRCVSPGMNEALRTFARERGLRYVLHLRSSSSPGHPTFEQAGTYVVIQTSLPVSNGFLTLTEFFNTSTQLSQPMVSSLSSGAPPAGPPPIRIPF